MAGGPERVGMGRAVGIALVLAVVELVVAHPRNGAVDDVELGSGRDAGKDDAGEQRAEARVHLVGVHVAERVERVGDVRGAYLAQNLEGGLADSHVNLLAGYCRIAVGAVSGSKKWRRLTSTPTSIGPPILTWVRELSRAMARLVLPARLELLQQVRALDRRRLGIEAEVDEDVGAERLDEIGGRAQAARRRRGRAGARDRRDPRAGCRRRRGGRRSGRARDARRARPPARDRCAGRARRWCAVAVTSPSVP